MKEQFRIGKLAQELGVKRFVIRFWEKEFNISPSRTSGGQRFYQQEDYNQFKLIKELLYEKGFTIAGAKKVLTQHTKKTALMLPTQKKEDASQKNSLDQDLINQIKLLQKQLIKLKNLL
ncbi:MAG: MerR family transcriptional regulator [Candidatus Babeliales bacterium]